MKKNKKVAPKNPVNPVEEKLEPGLEAVKVGDNPNIKIKVFGVGGGGCTIIGEIANVIPQGKRISFCAANSDIQSFDSLPKGIKLMTLGKDLTHGLGCGMNSEIGRQAAELSREEIKREISSSDFCIFISGLGGGTGSGAMPVFAEIAKSQKKLCLGIFTLPFAFEGEKRRKIALEALEAIKPHLSATMVIPNERIFQIIDPRTAIRQSFSIINKSLALTIKGLLETLYETGLINIDFADFKTILEGYGRAAYQNSIEGERKDLGQLVEKLLANPLLDNGIIPNTQTRFLEVDRIMFNITGPADLKMMEVEEISNRVSASNLKARIIFGILLKSEMSNKVRITLLAIGEDNGKVLTGKDSFMSFLKKPETHIEQKNVQVVKSENAKPASKKSKKIVKAAKKVAPVKKILKPEVDENVVRKNALDLKEEEHVQEKKILDQEKKWDIPAFLRIKK